MWYIGNMFQHCTWKPWRSRVQTLIKLLHREANFCVFMCHKYLDTNGEYLRAIPVLCSELQYIPVEQSCVVYKVNNKKTGLSYSPALKVK